jgi:photosystem II stability/assembly factor-like uncharacterized protein
MFSDDWKVWARHLESTKNETTLGKYYFMDDQRNEISA